MSKKVIKKVGDISYMLMNEVLIKKKDGLYKDSYWLEGAGYDTNGDGEISNITMICKIPDGKKDLILANISESCLFKPENENILVAKDINLDAFID